MQVGAPTLETGILLEQISSPMMVLPVSFVAIYAQVWPPVSHGHLLMRSLCQYERTCNHLTKANTCWAKHAPARSSHAFISVAILCPPKKVWCILHTSTNMVTETPLQAGLAWPSTMMPITTASVHFVGYDVVLRRAQFHRPFGFPGKLTSRID